MIRILQCVNDMHRAGLETMLMNYYRNIDRSEIQFDFLTHRPYRSDYDDEIESLGGKVYYAPRLYPQNYIAYFKWMKKFFSEHPEYKIVHSHIDTMSFLPLLAAKRAKVPYRIAHSHNTAIDKDFKYILKQIFRVGINYVANRRLACGEEAGKFLFGRNQSFDIICNAVDASKFKYSKEIRDEKRKALGIANEYVIGHIGRFSYQKNHNFLIEIFNALLKIEPNARLLLVGVGEKESEIKKKVKDLFIEDKVDFLENRADVSELYQAMDVFVLPSFFEGIPVVGVEAQFSDLPCIFSNKTPVEVAFNKKCSFIGLDDSIDTWISEILKHRNDIREAEKPNIVNTEYDIKHAYRRLTEYYRNLEVK